MHRGYPHISVEGDLDAANQLVPFAKKLLARAQAVADAAGVELGCKTWSPDQSTIIHAVSFGSVQSIHIFKESSGGGAEEGPTPSKKEEETVSPCILMFLSGTIFRGHIEWVEYQIDKFETLRIYYLSGFYCSTPCWKAYGEALKLPEPGNPAGLVELAVDVPAAFPELTSERVRYSQYTKLRPSMYSGRMQSVVQFIMGLGRAVFCGASGSYAKRVKKYGVQVLYDYRWYRTHGIAIADDGIWWLVEVSITRGVVARPLPIFNRHFQDHVRDAIIALERSALGRGELWVGLDEKLPDLIDAYLELGVYPTGESFPTDPEEYAKLKDAGIIRELLSAKDIEAFYKCSAYSADMGWAFNWSGSACDNTARYLHDDGFWKGVWYRITFNIGPSQVVTTRDNATGLTSTVLQVSASAAMTKVEEGKLYCFPARLACDPSNQWVRTLPIKIHDSQLGGLNQVDCRPTIEARVNGWQDTYCDTVVWVAYQEDDLKWIRYYRNDKLGPGTPADTPDIECDPSPYSYTTTETSASRYTTHFVYTSDFDDREELHGSKTVREYTCQPLGPSTISFGDDPTRLCRCLVLRSHDFRKTYRVWSESGCAVTATAAVPEGARDLYYYAYTKRFEITNYSFGVSRASLADYYFYLGCRDFPGWGVCTYCDPTEEPLTLCKNKSRIVHCERKRESFCSKTYANRGPWLKVGQEIEPVANASSPPPMSTDDEGRDHYPQPPKKQCRLVVVLPWVGARVLDTEPDNHDIYADMWHMFASPDPCSGAYQHIDATYSMLGDDGFFFRKGLDGHGGHDFLGVAAGNLKSNVCFIGVNRT